MRRMRKRTLTLIARTADILFDIEKAFDRSATTIRPVIEVVVT